MRTRREFLAAAGALALPAAWRAQAGRPYPQETDKIVRLAVVGGNFGASFHWHEHPNCRVVAVTDLRPDRRERLRQAYRCDNVYDSMEQMLAREKNLDAVALFSGAPDHFRHTEQCFRRGLHVVAACPAVASLEEAEELKALKEKTGLRYMMAESSYYRPACIYARTLNQSGGFGQIFYTEAEYYHDRGRLDELVTNKKTRFYEPDGSKSWRWGLAPMSYPTHAFCYVTGISSDRVVRISCLGWGSGHPWFDNRYKNPYWNESAFMQTKQGRMARCNVFFLVGADGERAQWFGEKGTLYMSNTGLNRDVWKDRLQGVQQFSLPQYWKTDPMLPPAMRQTSGHGDSAVFLCAEFINALIENREPAINVYESLAMTVPGIVAHQSALRNGEQLPVPLFDRKA